MLVIRPRRRVARLVGGGSFVEAARAKCQMEPNGDSHEKGTRKSWWTLKPSTEVADFKAFAKEYFGVLALRLAVLGAIALLGALGVGWLKRDDPAKDSAFMDAQGGIMRDAELKDNGFIGSEELGAGLPWSMQQDLSGSSAKSLGKQMYERSHKANLAEINDALSVWRAAKKAIEKLDAPWRLRDLKAIDLTYAQGRMDLYGSLFEGFQHRDVNCLKSFRAGASEADDAFDRSIAELNGRLNR